MLWLVKTDFASAGMPDLSDRTPSGLLHLRTQFGSVFFQQQSRCLLVDVGLILGRLDQALAAGKGSVETRSVGTLFP